MISPRRFFRRHLGLALAVLILPLAWFGIEWYLMPRPRVSWSEVIKTDPAQMNSDEPSQQALFALDGRSVALWSEWRLALRDLLTGGLRELAAGDMVPSHPAGDRVHHLQYFEGGRLLLGWLVDTGEPDDHFHSLRVWDVDSGRELFRAPKVGKDSVTPNFVISEDGSTLAYPPLWPFGSVGPRAEVGVWNRSRGEVAHKFPGVGPIALSGDGTTLAVTGPGAVTDKLLIYDVLTERRIATLPVDPQVAARDLALSFDGKTLAENRMPGVTLWDVATATRKSDLASQAYPTRFLGDGKLLALGNIPATQESCEIWNLAAEPPRRIFQGLAAGLSADGRLLIQNGRNPVKGDDPSPGGFDGSLRVVELPSFQPFSPTFFPNVDHMEFSADCRFLTQRTIRYEMNGIKSWLWRNVLRHLPRGTRFSLPPDPILIDGVAIGETATGKRLGAIDLPFVQSEPTLLADGKTLALHFLTPVASNPSGQSRSTVELWDVADRPRAARKPYFEMFVPFTLAAGFGFDFWSNRWNRRRANAVHSPLWEHPLDPATV